MKKIALFLMFSLASCAEFSTSEMEKTPSFEVNVLLKKIRVTELYIAPSSPNSPVWGQDILEGFLRVPRNGDFYFELVNETQTCYYDVKAVIPGERDFVTLRHNICRMPQLRYGKSLGINPGQDSSIYGPNDRRRRR